MKLALISGLFAAALAAASAADSTIYHSGWNDLNKNGKKEAYEDSAQPLEKRVADLLGRMTVNEKIGQLLQAHREGDAVTRYGPLLRSGGVSSFLDGSELIETPTQRNQLQRIAVEESRLGVPLIFGHDTIHGFRTIFPIPLGMASSWEPELFERSEAIAARETAAVGIDWTFAPMADLARDPRWGRIAEGYGEDPYLGALYAAASVKGFQGPNPADPERVIACLKHYVGYGAAEGGRDYNTTEISEYTLRNFYLPQFKAGVDAGSWTVMSAFNMLPGVGASADRHTLTEILRDEWKFQGFVISDWTSVEELIPHGVAANGAEAARIALHAGVDMEMVSTNYETIARQMKLGTISGTEVDEAVRRVLRVKFVKGLFDRPYVDEALYQSAMLRPDALALAREAAAKSCVLLKNTNGALPLSRSIKRVALIGPFADDQGDLLGCWAARGRAADAVSLAAGIRAKLGADAELIVVRGCDATGQRRTVHRLDGTQVAENGEARDEADINQAVEAAKNADAVILALGEPSSWSGENSSRSTLNIPGRQLELFDAVVATGKPVTVLLVNGRPLTIPELQEKAAAILDVWDPGVQGGNGVADVLFGDVNPAGRLTASFPRTLGQIPVHYNHYNTGRPQLGRYVDGPREPLYPFGFGLTYTTFEYGAIELSARSAKLGQPIMAQTNIRNTGSRSGTETVQLYIRDVAASAGPRPVRELRGYERVTLKPGESKTVRFELGDKQLGYYDSNGNWLVEPGRFQVWICANAEAGQPAEFEVNR